MKSRASEFVETRPIDHVFIARWWSIAMCAQVAIWRGATVIPTGGDPAGVGVTEARVMANILMEMGVEEEKLVLEEKAEDTTKRLQRAQNG